MMNALHETAALGLGFVANDFDVVPESCIAARVVVRAWTCAGADVPDTNGMDAPTLNGIKRAKVEVSATT